MTIEDAPSLSDFEKGASPVVAPVTPRNGKPRVRITIVALIVLALILGFNVMRQRGVFPTYSETGHVVGQVVDEVGTPMRAFIFVINTELEVQADAEGRFRLGGVPAGQQSLVIANEVSGREYPILVPANGEIDVGRIRFISTRVP